MSRRNVGASYVTITDGTRVLRASGLLALLWPGRRRVN